MDDFIFYDRKGRKIKDPWLHKSKVYKLCVKWRIQKNQRNGEVIDIIIDENNVELCPAMAALRIVERFTRCKRSRDTPSGIFKHESGVIRYITGHRIAWFFQNVARKVYPHMTDEEISRYSAHSIRFTAAVLLDEAGKDGKYIQTRIRWLGDSFKLYLRNTDVIAGQHVNALNKTGPTLQNLPDQVEYNAEIDESMETYD